MLFSANSAVLSVDCGGDISYWVHAVSPNNCLSDPPASFLHDFTCQDKKCRNRVRAGLITSFGAKGMQSVNSHDSSQPANDWLANANVCHTVSLYEGRSDPRI
ncbi:Uncharacterized protein HZ326_26787 [Fusarium oxysporum f. sp. albedinis]|nr:Uncharacterized protein HZ326_26787 [Fusarium oxysporum f. sp. albedinis]